MSHPARLWDETARSAAAKARTLRWLVFTIFVFAAMWIAINQFVGPVILPLIERLASADVHTSQENFELWRAMNLAWIEAGPLIALVWGLWGANAYLAQVEQARIWAAGTMRFFARIGDALWATALWLGLFAPTLTLWVMATEPFVFREKPVINAVPWIAFQIDPLILSLAGLGVALSLIARVFADVLRGAERLKQDAEAII
jgi:hypothetical protein